ncbi:MAG: TonB-dependent receptor [Vicinamibacteria bacterium]|nr:TonB-dependent receptor [Vicinamibacteria bacterium]
MRSASRRLGARALAAAACALLWPGLASAQEDFFEQAAQYFNNERIEGVSKHAEDPKETPATVTILSREDIERWGFRTLSEALNYASLGNFTLADKRYDLVGSRGLFFFEDFNTRVLVMLNGHPVNEPWSSFGGVGREMLVPLDLVERIEIVYGPSSLLYGGYSLYGIVNVVTGNGASEALAGWRVRLTGGNQGTGEGVASWGGSGTTGGDDPREWNVLVAAGYYGSAGEKLDLAQEDAGFPVRFDGSTTWGGLAEGVDAQRAPFAFALATRGDWSFMARTGLREKEGAYAPYGTVYADAEQTQRDHRTLLEAKWDKRLGNGWDVAARAFHDIYTYRERDPYADSSVFPPAPGYVFALNTDSRDTGGELRFSRRLGNHFLTFGGEVRHRSLGRDFRLQPLTGEGVGPVTEQDTTGRFSVLYAQEEWRPTETFTLVLGGNWADTNPGGSKAQPRVAAILKPDPKLSVKALYGRGFRPPTIFEASYEDGFETQVPNPTLESEEIESWELSTIWSATSRLALQGYAFRSRLEGLIQGVEIGAADEVQGGIVGPSGSADDLVGLLQYQSRGIVRSSGAGVSARFRDKGSSVYLNFAWSRARQSVDDGPEENLPASSAVLASVGFSQRFGDWTGSYAVRFVGPHPVDPARGTGDAGSFLTVAARVSYKTRLVYPVTFHLDLRNLLDEEGLQAASYVYVPQRLPVDGRRVELSAELRF